MFGWLRKAGREGRTTRTRTARGFLTRIARNRKGNTLAIIAASLIPLTAMIGSGVDISRAYMAKSRLQNACDAAALAGRRAMTGDSFTQAVQDEAIRYFNFNFPQGTYQTAAFTPVVTKPQAGTIRVAVSTSIPTAIMGIFGYGSLPLSVTCDGSQNYVNTDIMLVLDTTGSMLCAPEDTNNPCTQLTDPTTVDANGVRGLTTTRIYALRSAVMAMQGALAPVQTQLEAAGMRLRYGVVPYSSSVNVGGLIRAVNSDYLRSSTPYYTRTANYTSTQADTDNTVTETYGSSISSANCTAWGANNYPTAGSATVVTGGPAPTPVTTETYTYRDWGVTGDTSGTTRTCRRYRRTQVDYNGYYPNGSWTYQQASVDTSQFRLGNAVSIATSNNGISATSRSNADPVWMAANVTGVSTASTTWNGCIEERDTTSTINTSTDLTIPTSAYDLNPDFIPSTEATRWRPMWPELSYLTNGTSTVSRGTAYYACPTEARRLQAWTAPNLLSYVNGLVPIGGTYHDIGMIWGTRMLSGGGIFADSPATFNGMPATRHIIFMTDGQLAPNTDTYTAYGIEYLDQRVTGSSSATGQYDRHLQRFKMMCNQARSMNISIWVIAFGTTLSQDMIDCASNPNQASTASNRQQLIDRFTEIGQNIGALRLTQ